MPLQAETFILASGSFISHGLEADPEHVYEPLFGLDVDADSNRPQWSHMNIYTSQQYMSFGVRTDDRFRVSRNGQTVSNLFAAGSILSGSNAVKEESGAGITLLTALNAADTICNCNETKTQKLQPSEYY